MSGVSPFDALMSVKIGTFREFQLYMVSLQIWHLAVTPLLERQMSRRHLIFGPAIGTLKMTMVSLCAYG
jgi:hypothetical protein